MKNFFRLAAVAVVALSLNSCCGGCDAPKFNAKEYAKNKTERLDKLVELTDAQEKEIYNIYLAQGKEMKKNMAAAKKACGDMKCPDGKKAECAKPCPPKPECGKPCPPKPECNKPCEKKAECAKPCAKPEGCTKKAECGKKADCPKKAECTKPCEKKAECKKACDKKANCEKPCAKKAECGKKADCTKKAECAKPCAKPEGCTKKAECTKNVEGCKPCHKGKKPECGKPQKPNFPRHEFVSPEAKKATFEQIRSVLTEEQNKKIHEHFAKRKQFAPKVKACAPTAAPGEK